MFLDESGQIIAASRHDLEWRFVEGLGFRANLRLLGLMFQGVGLNSEA